MDRRDMLKASALAPVIVAASGVPTARAQGGGAGGATPPSTVGPFDLDEASVADLRSAMRSGQRTAASIAQAYLERMDAVDRTGPAIQAVIERNPDAMALAEALDRERREKGVRGPLHGIPVLLKDNIDTGDRMRTSAGSLALADHVAKEDAFLVTRLRQAGCVILGKANLSEWANFRGARSTSGWSARGGQTRNPYALDRNTSGSSSGSAAAVTANLCAVAVGTETDGSIVSPSSICGLVGIKPTVGLVSRGGIIPIAASQDTAGPMARTVTDAALLLGAMAAVDARDPATGSARGKIADYTKALDPGGLRSARIGVARDFFGGNDRVDRVVADAIAAMKDAGAVIVDPVRIPHHDALGTDEYEVLLYEFKAYLNAYLRSVAPSVPVHSLADVIAFNEREALLEMPYFGQEHMVAAQAKGRLTDKAYGDARRRNVRMSRHEGLDLVLRKHRLDALVAPTGSPAWPIDHVNGDHAGSSCSQMPAVSGYPHITVPAGVVFGLPVGVSFFGAAWSEPTLIRLAFAFEQATRARRPPSFPSTAARTA